MKKKLLSIVAILSLFAPVAQANVFKGVAKTVYDVHVEAKDAIVDGSSYIKKHTWGAPIGNFENGGKVVVCSIAAIIAADQLYNKYVNDEIATSGDYSLPLRQSLTEKVANFYNEKVSQEAKNFIADYGYITLGLAYGLAMASIYSKHHMGSFNESRFECVTPANNTTTMDSIIGHDKAKTVLKDIIDMIKNPSKFTKLGKVTIPKGIILEGPPGVGKTALVRASSNELGMPLFITDGASFNGIYRGSGVAQVEKLFKEAAKVAPSAIFIDEADSVLGKSSSSNWCATDNDQTINKFKSLIDGFNLQNPSKPIILMAATNHANKIDPALTRDGRLSVVTCSYPSKEESLQIFDSKLKNIVCASGIDTQKIIDKVYKSGVSNGAYFEALANTSVIIAGRNNESAVSQNSIYKAIEEMSARKA
jgi:ATP-dependent Zn protease